MSLSVPSFLGFSAVGLGAFGAHALKESLAASGHTAIWQTAVLYHLLHAVAVLAVVLVARAAPPAFAGNTLRAACFCWVIGILLFSGSLYALALGGPRWFGPVTPLGGLSLLAGWVCVGLAAKGAKERA